MARDKTMKALLASIESKEVEIMRLQAQVDALREVYNQGSGTTPALREKSSIPIKTTVLNLLEKVGGSGLNANIACSLARQEGIELQSKTVSSLLSRFKNEGTVVHDGSKYYLPKFRDKRHEPTLPTMPGLEVVRPLRTSGQSS
jgi:hypothetical protein